MSSSVSNVVNYVGSQGTYTGRVVNNLLDGKGTLTTPDGEKHDGEWRAGDRHGRGAHSWSSGHTYDGEWHNGHMDGWGVSHFPGGWYEGLLRGDRWKRGTLKEKNGNVRVGCAKEDKHGAQGSGDNGV
ncbi:hypothetical protein Pelo_19347 [Pelomyxa schiedti]|nr:hypothetical protein Pelo_19347 [Pelomyxa schiedti]